MSKEEQLKILMEKKSGSIKAFAKEIDLPYTTIRSILERGIYNAKVENVIKICKGLNIKTEDILNSDTQTPTEVDYIREETVTYYTPVIELPVLAKVSAGLPIYAEENIISQIHVSKSLIKDGKEYFGLIVSGDSMDKEFKDGDIVIVEKDAVIENGQIGVVMVNGYNATVKRVRYNGDMIILQPESHNSDHQPQFYNKNDKVKFVGRVVGMNRKY
ncbi:XRE family transcriptional regulator [Macrococcoides goetzii]|uniref:XRE family transcriptional regulator n=1 Tax=Macrococcoides goetzii TaxID=1891097 RepID=A0A2G5NUP7_9STAP|nr:XRE family transcriptional regulator [Macrococcus goetzii]RAI79705.1 XRE family transcriptional regulator [Macrococcus goetzii]